MMYLAFHFLILTAVLSSHSPPYAHLLQLPCLHLPALDDRDGDRRLEESRSPSLASNAWGPPPVWCCVIRSTLQARQPSPKAVRTAGVHPPRLATILAVRLDCHNNQSTDPARDESSPHLRRFGHWCFSKNLSNTSSDS